MPKFSAVLLFLFICLTGHGNNIELVQHDKQLIQPMHLKKGDTILILAPSGKIKNKDGIIPGVELAKKWGLNVIFGEHLYSSDGSFSGTDEERSNDFQIGLDNPMIKAIWCARGGYGAVRIIDKLDFTKFKQHPKWIVGYSDITVIHNTIHNIGYQTIHGQMPMTLDSMDPSQFESVSTLYKSLFGKKLKYKIPSSEFNKEGNNKGALIGGNLSILCSMLGSHTSLQTSNKVLFLEDVGEELYHIDRMIISLKRAGYFENLSGLIIGDFRLKKNESNPFGKTLEEIILEATEGSKFPIIFNFPAGHIDDNRALILGATIAMTVTKKTSVINFKK